MTQIPGAFQEAMQFCIDVSETRDVSARLFIYAASSDRIPAVQAQIRFDREGDDLAWIAQTSRERGYKVTAVDEGLMAEIA
ncbi:MAG: hypothetical protein AB7V58_12870 [Solirubrobacterales bacterium]